MHDQMASIRAHYAETWVPFTKQPAACKLLMAAEIAVEQHDLNCSLEVTEGPQVSVPVFLDND